MIKNKSKKPVIFSLICFLAITIMACTMADQLIKTKGVHHVGLTVRDVESSSKFFIETLNFTKVGEKPNYPAIFVSDGSVMITLWQASNPESAISFDRKNNIGLHHLALGLDSFEELDKMYEKLKNHSDISIEFAPELLGKGPAKHMMFYEPSGVRVELIVRP